MSECQTICFANLANTKMCYLSLPISFYKIMFEEIRKYKQGRSEVGKNETILHQSQFSEYF